MESKQQAITVLLFSCLGAYGIAVAESAPSSIGGRSANHSQLALADPPANPSKGSNSAGALASPFKIQLKELVVWNGLLKNDAAAISTVYKSTRTVNYLFSDDNKSWLYDQKLDNQFGGSVARLDNPVAAQPGSRLYSLQTGNFWMISPTTITGRRKPLDVGAKAVSAMQFSTEFQTNKVPNVKTIYVDNFRMLFSNDTEFYAVEKTDDGTIRNLTLTIPEGSTDKPIIAGGLGEDFDQFWVARKDDIYFLVKKDGVWTWSKAALQIEMNGAPLGEAFKALGMVVKFNASGPVLDSTAFVRTTKGFFATEKLTPLFLVEDDMIPIGNNLVKPQFMEKCISCHPEFSLLSGIKDKAAAIERRVGDRTMPPLNSPPLGGLERGVILRWIRMGFLPPPN